MSKKNPYRKTIPGGKRWLVALCFLLIIGWYGGVAYAVDHGRGIEDWLVLEGYTAPTEVATVATQDTMTPAARRILYVNHPGIQDAKTFAVSCASVAHQEQTIVLGCFLPGQAGIYVLKVTDPRLDGVEQVTTAHEMLHAAYERLSTAQRSKVNAELEDYYEHGLTDQRIKDTIAAYKVSEPNDVVNEMHSVFGTEVPSLPPLLEQYYKQYFTDRQAVTTYASQYDAEFTSREDQVKAYDAQLSSLKQQIDANNADLDRQETAIDARRASLNSLSTTNPSLYNAEVPGFNAQVNAYNAEIAANKQLINQYNGIVQARNSIVLEEQQLEGELSGSSVPAAAN